MYALSFIRQAFWLGKRRRVNVPGIRSDRLAPATSGMLPQMP
jgi:hypothetical protein